MPFAPSPTELAEDFEGKLSALWQGIWGAQIGNGCGTISEGKALYFGSSGRREARTVPMDTASSRLVLQQFICCLAPNVNINWLLSY